MNEAPTANNKENHFEIVSNEKKYDLKITINKDYIIIEASCINSLQKETYQNSFSFSDMQKYKYFKICESLDEAYLLLSESANSKDIKLIQNSKNEITIIIPINNALIKEISFQLKIKEKNIEDKVNELFIVIEKQQKEIDVMKKEIEELKTYKKKEVEEKEKFEEKFMLKNSLILNKNDEEAIRDWINPNKNLKFKLLFRMSRDGSNCSDFHRFCDDKGETLLLFKTDTNCRFGAYTPLKWVTPPPNQTEINDPSDNLTFLFSLNKMKKFTKIPGKDPQTARSQKNYGPLLGAATDLGISPDMRTGWSGNLTYLTNYELTNGKSSFNLSEIEVYKVD